MKTLIDEESLKRRVAELGAEIDRIFGDEPYTMLVLLNGGMIFGADLLRTLHGNVQLDTLAVSSYESECSCGELYVRTHLKLPVAGRNILLVDEIFDSGLTLSVVRESLLRKSAGRVVSCVLLDKQVPKKTAYRPDLIGFSIEDVFVVGYGLDRDENFRNLPCVMTL